MPEKDENWRPKLRRIEDPIAEDFWEYTTPSGKQRISRLTVGRPVHYPERRLWYCPVLIEGYTKPRFRPIFGMGPVDSLMNAMTFVRRFFEENFEVLPGAMPASAQRTRPPGVAKRSAPQRTPQKKHPRKARTRRAK
ncbi:hypothetical protein [Pyxidicoccus xibeiensis]|uniref:hypothetical protein n=1 Tax=Pyxidicoccus xibeiensis TaxID=2906759 RepID=UPI0020A720AE|nr:hypothetical protein [Pyxidicoccus xibeiensis]MCP3142417.1 hypothetical protein [Pyxidicoccus xibeiensis]